MTKPLDDARGELLALAEELREFTAMKYMGDCKCSKCQLVPRELIDRLYAALRAAPARCDAVNAGLPKPETMLTYASILEKPQYWIDPKTSQKYQLATGEIVEAACAALRHCAALSPDPGTVAVASTHHSTPQEVAGK